ncbi:MAG: tRNA lysidine(34) synthetase TilS [Phycisphaerales bacterium]|nr:tRNA lysidine(34) synthetase TilS [Phycisphaerales bacterium]
MVLSLAEFGDDVVLGHVVHDFRPREAALGDRDHVAALAKRLGLAFAVREVSVRHGPGNAEARARNARYAALASMAAEHGCGWVATAHHAEDQLETMVLRLMRGAGAPGLAGIRERTRLAGVRVIRPLLALTRANAEAICTAAGERWRTDQTNRDTSRDRAFLRLEIVPRLLDRWPAGAQRAAQAGRLLALTADHMAREAARLSVRAARGEGAWDRTTLAEAPDDVLGAWLRRTAQARGVRSGSLTARRIASAIRALRAAPDRRRLLEFGPVIVVVGAKLVSVERAL